MISVDISIVLSILAIVISIVTFWLTYVHKGQLGMSHPSLIFFGPEGNGPKIFFRALLYSTSRKGQLVEYMYVKISRKEVSQIFDIWVYGEPQQLRIGSGLFVGESGATYDHHFICTNFDQNFLFFSGTYSLEVYVKLVNTKRARKLFQTSLEVSKSEAHELTTHRAGLMFNWGAESRQYTKRLDKKPKSFWEN